MRNHRPVLLPIVLLSILALAGCGCSGESRVASGNGVRELKPKEAAAVVAGRAADPSFVLLDVRTPEEFARERIAGARNLDFHSPRFREELAVMDRDWTYLLYCRTGNRSAKSLPVLRELGFRHVLHLTEGIRAWKDGGHPVEIGPAPR
jgi:rhodanese-related sulfurtransferase